MPVGRKTRRQIDHRRRLRPARRCRRRPDHPHRAAAGARSASTASSSRSRLPVRRSPCSSPAGLSGGYIQTLERSLRNRAAELELSDIATSPPAPRCCARYHAAFGGQTLYRPALRDRPASRRRAPARPPPWSRSRPDGTLAALSTSICDRSSRSARGTRNAVLRVLRNDEGIPASLVPHVIPLLAWDPVAEDAVNGAAQGRGRALGELTDALIDPNQDFAIRRRLARVFSVCVSQRAADGLLLGLDDQRFEVRFQCARALAAMVEKNPRVRIDKAHIFDVVAPRNGGRSAGLGKPSAARSARRQRQPLLRRRVREGSRQPSLAHVFTLLSLVLPPEPLQIAFKGPAHDASEPARHGARVPGRRAAAADPRRPLAVSRGRAVDQSGRTETRPRRNCCRSAAIARVHHGEPAGIERPRSTEARDHRHGGHAGHGH